MVEREFSGNSVGKEVDGGGNSVGIRSFRRGAIHRDEQGLMVKWPFGFVERVKPLF